MRFAMAMGLIVAAVAFSARAELLWEIGVADDSAAEFALSSGKHADYSMDGLFVVGQSVSVEDWPYVHPGPADGWAGGKKHTFRVIFGISEVPADGKCALHVGLVDSHNARPPMLKVSLNGFSLQRQMPLGTSGDAALHGGKGNLHKFWLSFPVTCLAKGENELVITTEDGSWVVYDWLGFEAPASVKADAGAVSATRIGAVDSLPVLVDEEGALKQTLRIPVWHFGDETAAEVRMSGVGGRSVSLERGARTIRVSVPAVDKETSMAVSVEVGGQTVSSQEVVLKPVRKWEVHLLHHTHLDIGYTHLQSDVEKRQWEHLEKGIEYARKTVDYPEGSRFVWLPEGLWAIESYLAQATPEKRAEFVEAVEKGWVALDALYGNALTGLYRPEELLELTEYARRLSREHGFTIDSAMITDVPGYTWGIVPALAHSGVKYFSVGPNMGHRIGFTIEDWGDKPFYWVSPSGKHKVLCWVAGTAYSWLFNEANLKQEKGMFDYLTKLGENGYPYDIVHVRYCIGGDNGPPDPVISDFVRDWNERYAYPKLILSTPTRMCKALEDGYAESIPEVSGDFTPYWEDGAASSARETILNRAAAERLVQANALWAMCDVGPYPADEFHAAWREAILYDEHTWGAHNSITEPESDFALGQWAIKQAFALEADRRSKDLVDRAIAGIRAEGRAQAVQVLNTLSWPRTDLVVLPSEMDLPGDLVRNAAGEVVPSQRLKSGELAFMAADVPAMGGAKFTVHAGAAHGTSGVEVGRAGLSNGDLALTLNEETGAIASLKSGVAPFDFVDGAKGLGLNDYFYVEGRAPDSPLRNGKPSIRVGDAGPLVASLIVESDAPGCRGLKREVRLVAGLDRVDIIDTIDKEKVYDPEGVHVAFPFNVPGGVTRMDLPFAVARVEDDQISGSCKNYYTVQRWLDVSNGDVGVTWATPDAPLVEIGAITCDPRRVGWLREAQEPRTTLYSYVMNNYWETNYKAAQEGAHDFRYSIRPHGQYDQARAQCFGVERGQPLLAVAVADDSLCVPSALKVEPSAVMVTAYKRSDDGKARIVRLFNGGDKPCTPALTWGEQPKAVFLSGLDEEARERLDGPVELAPYEILTLRCE